MASSTAYAREDAMVVDVNNRIHLLTSCMKDFDVAYTMSKLYGYQTLMRLRPALRPSKGPATGVVPRDWLEIVW